MAKRQFNNVDMDIPRFHKNKNLYQEFDGDSLKEILTSIPWEIVNIPLYSYKKILMNDDTRTGNQVVGYIIGYDVENDIFNTVIHEKYAAKVSEFQSPIIFPRVQTIGPNVTRVLGFDVCPNSYYAVIR